MYVGYWFEEALAQAGGVETTPLDGAATADVCIVGGGFLGLWTAIRLKEADPSLDVAIVERWLCGSGASGRNGGMVDSWWAKFATLIELCGEDEARRLADASDDAVRLVGAYAAEHGIDAEYRRDGRLWTATSEAQMGAWRGLARALARHGAEPLTEVDRAEACRLASTDRVLGGVFEANAATVQPAKLGLGLRRRALDLGVSVHEESPLIRLQRSERPVVHTARGRIEADKVVIAMNAWGVGFPELRRFCFPLAADMIATEASPDTLAAAGWTTGIGLCDSHLALSFWRNTTGGRVVFGKALGKLGFGGAVDSGFDGASTRRPAVESQFRAYYPALAGIPVSHDWTGPIDRTMKAMPVFGRLGGHPNILFGIGFSGEGIAPTTIGARILSALARGADDAWSRAGLVRDTAEPFPPEPFRYVGGRIIRSVVHRMDRLQDAGRAPGPLTRALARLAPPGALPKRED